MSYQFRKMKRVEKVPENALREICQLQSARVRVAELVREDTAENTARYAFKSQEWRREGAH
jgi:hypothetical protein